ncbi:sigma-54 interaction domain-containing protein [Variovorax ginsengisoli]|uniref:Transcriptional regulator with PAS, ATPase and Fis domain n=1 Tax=Variovorax ginsengisoli TaxID=363844 RepID=A0ABT9SER7_9BURK|nr:sigma 54-interacting transcriptional regulator [Variovorax ginsengisoli]MDP9902862.1 transcriptional regulator with PAS, ATPase and Fis domain [Variovorax ginsengisoli]
MDNASDELEADRHSGTKVEERADRVDERKVSSGTKLCIGCTRNFSHTTAAKVTLLQRSTTALERWEITDMTLKSSQIAALFDTLAAHSEGIVLVDELTRIVWISDAYLPILPKLSINEASQLIGRKAQDVIPNTRLHEVVATGQPVMMDLMVSSAGTFLVSRIPLRDKRDRVTGAIGIVWLTDPIGSLRPLMSKFVAINHELKSRQLHSRNARNVQYTLDDYLGSSGVVRELKRKVKLFAQSGSAVLLLGETGTGKEILAQSIHEASSRRNGPFVAINVAAIPETLLEAELFGVAPGAYTGAEKNGRRGKLELANTGTLFLDEIGDMPLSIQVKLLRVLQERVLEPLGANKLVAIDVRLVSATSVDLQAKLRTGAFRADLYYRLSALPIHIPPIRERADDIPMLAEALLRQIAGADSSPQKKLTRDALTKLSRGTWPGNYRQLRNVLEYAVVMCEGSFIRPEHIEITWHEPASVSNSTRSGVGEYSSLETIGPLTEQTRAFERSIIRTTILAFNGDKNRAALALQISRASLYQKLKP